MSEHRASVRWRRTSQDFTYDTYNRAHEMVFKAGGIALPASSAPAFLGDAERVDPEEAYVAALSSCHMLTFLAICARKRLTIDAYEDDASGSLEKDTEGKLWMARVTLRPLARFADGTNIAPDMLGEIHHRAHVECFIARSVRTDVTVAPRL